MQQKKLMYVWNLKPGIFPGVIIQRNKLTIFPKYEYLHNINHTVCHVKE